MAPRSHLALTHPAGECVSVLGLDFEDQGLLRQALVHRSYLNEHPDFSLESYERMEFLGDAVLELAVSTALYDRLPSLAEGELTKLRSQLVCGESLAAAARSIGLGDALLLGRGEETTGGRSRNTILAAAFEALIAAVFLDRGYQHARDFVLETLAAPLEKTCLHGAPQENPKSALQELFQGLGEPAPTYRLAGASGPDHRPVFTVEALLGGEVIGCGEGGRKSDAERAAAQDALDRWQPSSAPAG